MFLLLLSGNSLSQSDTTINKLSFTVLERYENGKAKEIGQFGTTCSDTIQRKHGYFISFDETGKEINKTLYFFDDRRNKKFLGVKYGWWGWYGMTTKYWMGVKTKMYMTDPCF